MERQLTVDLVYELNIAPAGEEEKFTDLEVTAEVLMAFESDYGADADGNRGRPFYYADDIEDLEILNDEGDNVTEKIEKDFLKDFEKIIEEVKEKAGE